MSKGNTPKPAIGKHPGNLGKPSFKNKFQNAGKPAKGFKGK